MNKKKGAPELKTDSGATTIAFGLLSLGAVAILAYRCLLGLYYSWNALRALPALGLLEGYSLYYPPGVGPLLPRAYPPIGLLVYLPLAWFRTPNAVVIAGQVLSSVLTLGAAAWFLFKLSPAKNRIIDGLGFFFLFLLVFTFSSATDVLCNIHVDAAALAAGILACGWALQSLENSNDRQAWVAGILFAIACFSKQNMAFAPLGILVLAWIRSRKIAWAMVKGGLLGGLLLATPLLWHYGWDTLYYQWFSYLKNFPFDKSWHQIARPVASQWIVPAFLVLGGWVYLAKNSAAKLRVLVPASIAVSLSLISVLAFRKSQGGGNSIGVVTFFLCLAAVKAFQYFLEKTESKRYFFSTVLGILLCWSGGLFLLEMDEAHGSVEAFFILNLNQIAYEIALKHPNQVYFPYVPLANFLVDRKLYHSGTEIEDLASIQQPTSSENFQKFLPTNLQFIILTNEWYKNPVENYTSVLPQFRPVVDDSHYSWTILGKQ